MVQRSCTTAKGSSFLSIPTEIRLLVYEYLLDDGGNRWLAIRSRPDDTYCKDCRCLTRSRYLVLDQTIHRRCYETTYQLATPAATFHTGIMATNRLVHMETSHILYGRHAFDFGADLAAAVPFFQDRTTHTRHLLSQVTLQKQAPVPTFERDRSEWAGLCRYLAATSVASGHAGGGSELKLKLRLVIEGNRPPTIHPTEDEEAGAATRQPLLRPLSVGDLEALMHKGDERLEWVSELARAQGAFEGLEVVLRDRFCSPWTEEMEAVAALSASVNRGGMESFLRKILGLETPYMN